MLTSEDMFLYEQLPNFVTNTPALEKLLKSVLAVPGVETIQLTHITMAPVVKDPTVIERLTPLTVPYSHVTHRDSTDPNQCMVDPAVNSGRILAPTVAPVALVYWGDPALARPSPHLTNNQD